MIKSPVLPTERSPQNEVIVLFLGIKDEDEAALIKQDAYQKINYLIGKM